MRTPPETPRAIALEAVPSAWSRAREALAKRKGWACAIAGALLGASCPWWPEHWRELCKLAGKAVRAMAGFL